MGKYVRILCGMMAVLVAATALGLWQLAEAPQYVAAAESRGQAKPVSFGTDTALVPVHLESTVAEIRENGVTVTGKNGEKQDIPADPCQPQIFLHFYISRR